MGFLGAPVQEIPPVRVAMFRGSFGAPASVLEIADGDSRDSGRLTRSPTSWGLAALPAATHCTALAQRNKG